MSGKDQARLSPSSHPLLFPATFPATKSGGPRPLALGHLGDPVLFANRSAFPSFSAVHSAVFDRINRRDVVGATTGAHMTAVMDVLAGGAIKCLIDKAVNPQQPASNPNLPVAVEAPRAAPCPAIAVDGEARVQPRERFVRKHNSQYAFIGLQRKPSPTPGDQPCP